tara:strand:- start:819 stop:1703 length:885 start_codon:yes stop_codon:yes gene_type:complete
MKLFITGSESFIGKELIKYCIEKSIDFVGIDKSNNNKSQSINIDIRDKRIENYLEKDSIIIHLAAISRDSDCRDDCINAFDINVNGTINLINAAKKKKVKQFIFASSEWVYGNTINNSEQEENDKIDITGMESEYAITKIIGEQLIKINNKNFISTILRFGIIYGPRKENWSAFEAIFNLVRVKNKAEIGSFKTSRRFIHVKDIVRGIIASLNCQSNDIFNLCGDDDITLKNIIDESLQILNKNNFIVSEKDGNNPNIRKPVNTHAKNKLAWKPLITFQEGLLELKEYFEKEKI